MNKTKSFSCKIILRNGETIVVDDIVDVEVETNDEREIVRLSLTGNSSLIFLDIKEVISIIKLSKKERRWLRYGRH